MSEKIKIKKVLVTLAGEQVDQLGELERRDGSNGNVVLRKALAVLFERREELMPVKVA